MSKFFNSQKSKELSQWKLDLRSQSEMVRKETIMKVIQAMTYSQDLSSLFSEMLYVSHSRNIEIKKLVYLYMMNYAKLRKEFGKRVVEQFSRDTRDDNPIIRGLAIRSLSSLRVDGIAGFLLEPLKKAAKDKDAYVRKCAAIAIGKYYALDPSTALEKGFVDLLNDMLTDSIPVVVANAVASLTEICKDSKNIDLTFKSKTIKILLAALKECTEWGQVYILDAIADYSPEDRKETDMLIEQIFPRLNHSNSAVVLSAVKVLVHLIEYQSNKYSATKILLKISGPLVTLLANPPEIQFVALKNISLIVQKYPAMLEKSIKMFFCKYDDPIYVKIEKIKIMVKLVTKTTINQVLLELKEYSQEVDVDFVRQSVRAIGRCAIKLQSAAQQCIDVLVALMKTKINYVVQEAVIVIKDIFRKYPNKYEKVISKLCENLDTLDQPEAKGAMIWIIGEYADRIEDSEALLELFVETFVDETPEVQLQVISAAAKLYLKIPTKQTRALVKKVVDYATDDTDNPDLRDRGFIYWRLISQKSLVNAKKVILATKKTISEDSDNISEGVLEKLLENMSTLSSVYQKPPEMFIPDYQKDDEEEFSDDEEGEEEEEEKEQQDSSKMQNVDDMLGMEASNISQPQLLDGFGAGKGLSVFGEMTKKNGKLYYNFTFRNDSKEVIDRFAAKFNKNPWGLAPKNVVLDCENLKPGKAQKFECELQFAKDNVGVKGEPKTVVQVAIKFDKTLVYFQDSFKFEYILLKEEKLSVDTFQVIAATCPNSVNTTFNIKEGKNEVMKILELHNIQFIVQSESQVNYCTKVFFNGEKIDILVLLVYKGDKELNVFIKSGENYIPAFMKTALESILKPEKKVEDDFGLFFQ